MLSSHPVIDRSIDGPDGGKQGQRNAQAQALAEDSSRAYVGCAVRNGYGKRQLKVVGKRIFLLRKRREGITLPRVC